MCIRDRYGVLELAVPLFSALKDTNPQQAKKAKRLIINFHETLPTNDVSALESLLKIIEPDDADFFRRTLAETDIAETKKIAILGLQRLGFEQELQTAIVKLVESRELDDEFYNEYTDFRGDGSIEFFKKRIDELISASTGGHDLLTIR